MFKKDLFKWLSKKVRRYIVFRRQKPQEEVMWAKVYSNIRDLLIYLKIKISETT